jgi:GGDEF domain-containing protein
MADYRDLSEQERRRLYREFHRAAEALRDEAGGAPPRPQGAGLEAEEQKRFRERLRLGEARRVRRPSWRLRLQIDSYASSEGFEICGLRELVASFFAFLRPHQDAVSRQFARRLLRDQPPQTAAAGFSLSRSLLEIRRRADFLLRGGDFLKRASDRGHSIRGELKHDLLVWEPFGYELLDTFNHHDTRLLDTLSYLRFKLEQRRGIDIFDLRETVIAVYRLALATGAPFELVEGHIDNVGALVKSIYVRIYSSGDRLAQVYRRIDEAVEEFLALYVRLKYFAHQLYPALLKMLNVFRREESAHEIADQIYAFIGLDPDKTLKAEAVTRRRPAAEAETEAGEAEAQDQAGPAGEAEPAASEKRDLEIEFEGILTILEYAFPGSRIAKIIRGDYGALFWFHQNIFRRQAEGRQVGLLRRPDFFSLLWKISLRDPLAPVILLYELVASLLASVDPDILSQLADPLAGSAFEARKGFARLREDWPLIRDRLFTPYLREIDYFEKEVSLSRAEYPRSFTETAAGRKTVERINQMRNHVIRGYGHTAMKFAGREGFSCPPLYSLVQELLALLERVVPERSQLRSGNPVIAERLERNAFVNFQGDLVIRQIASYLEAVPRDKRLLEKPRAEAQRLFLEILSSLADLLSFYLNDADSPLLSAGGEIAYAGKEERRIRESIGAEKPSLRVELKKDFDEIDQLTRLVSKNEYLRFIPDLYRACREENEELSFLILDIDHFKVINDAQGHEFGDEYLRSLSRLIRSSLREEDTAVRFGGEEILVILRGDADCGLLLAERIRRACAEMLAGDLAERLEEIVYIMARKEAGSEAEEGFQEKLAAALALWREVPVGTVSIGVAQGLGGELTAPCPDAKALFILTDRMLYLAKDAGRNRVVGLFPPLNLPLLYPEFEACRRFMENNPDSPPQKFREAREAENRRLAFHDYAPPRDPAGGGRPDSGLAGDGDQSAL